MEKITIDKTKNENGFQKLLEAKLAGKDAKWEFGGYVTTTDMIPEQFANMRFEDIEAEMKRNAVIVKMDLIEKNTEQSYIEAEVDDDQYYAMFEQYEQEKSKKDSKVM